MISDKIRKLTDECESQLSDVFAELDRISQHNTEKVLECFRRERVSERHFNPSTGYGYNDDGRDVADKLFASALGCEAGFVSHNIISGTHAIALGLFALLRPGDKLLSVTGRPYDTLETVIGFGGAEGSLMDIGVLYDSLPLIDGKTIDIPRVVETLKNDSSIKMVYVQRSKGYDSRRTLTAKEITSLFQAVKAVSDALVFVDNNYGEFTATEEPKADILAGSLIKNAGGGIAECGGYIVGSTKAVEKCAARLTVPTVGREAGATLGQNKPIIKGLFYAPHTVANAKKTAHLAALLFKKLGFPVNPDPFEMREDIIQIISLGNAERLLKFCHGIQMGSPVDSFAVPVACDMPGYESQIVMAAGAFTQGSSIELSADAPLREPYDVYMQGGLTYESGKTGVMIAATLVSED